MDVQLTNTGLEELELDGRSEPLKVEVRSKMLDEPNESRSPKMPVGERDMSKNQQREAVTHETSDVGEVRDDGTKRRGFEGE